MRNFTDFANYEIVLFWRIKTDILIKTVENLKDWVKRCLSKAKNIIIYWNMSRAHLPKDMFRNLLRKNCMTLSECVVIFLKTTCGRI